MKRIISFALTLILLVLPLCCITVSAEDISVNIDTIATDLLQSALENPVLFGVPELNDKHIYICEPIHPYAIENETLVENDTIEYYLLIADNEYFACVTVCYDQGIAQTATLSTTIATILETYDIEDSAFLLVLNGGKLYLKTESTTVCGSGDTTAIISSSDSADLCAQIDAISFVLDGIEVKNELQLVQPTAIGRSSTTLSVPYVPQGDMPICWAAAAAAFGQYYTGNAYSALSAYDLACIVGVGCNGASIEYSQQILEDVFHIQTTAVYTMSASQIINKLVQRQPVIAGFHNGDVGHVVVICGYDDHSTGENIDFYVRDSNTPNIKIVKTLSNGTLIMDYYNVKTMKFEVAVYKS